MPSEFGRDVANSVGKKLLQSAADTPVQGCGLAVDAAAGYLYLGNMGDLKANDGSILRCDLDGGHMTTNVPTGATFTPKRITIDILNDKLYWSDREGMRVMRA